jgi:hypothetical protein
MQEDQNPSSSGAAAPDSQPGQVITPGAPQAQPPAPLPPAPIPPAPLQAPEPAPATPFAEAAAPVSSDGITWTASEYIAHDKSPGWYGMLALAALVLAAIFYFMTKDPVSPAVVVVSALLLGVYGARKPRQLQYGLGPDGITVGAKHYTYGEFRSFSMVDDGAFSSIVFQPLKRFAPPLTIYFAPEDEDHIVSVLSSSLPLDQHQPDAVDRLMRRIRF